MAAQFAAPAATRSAVHAATSLSVHAMIARPLTIRVVLQVFKEQNCEIKFFCPAQQCLKVSLCVKTINGTWRVIKKSISISSGNAWY